MDIYMIWVINKKKGEIVMKYKVGDKVRIRRDLEVGEIYGDSDFIETMEQFKGEVVTIIDVNETSYNIKEDNIVFFWTDEMIECKIYNNVDEFWSDWKNEKVGVKFNNADEFNNFINNYHYKHFNIKLSTVKEDIGNNDIIKYRNSHFDDEEWTYILSDEVNNYNIITYEDFIKLIEKEKLEESIIKVEKIAEGTKSPKNDKQDKNVPAENIDGMGTFESEISNKNPILMEQINLPKTRTKDRFFDIDFQVLENIYKLFKSVENETNLSKIDDILDIIDEMIDVKNKVLNSFDTSIFDEMDKSNTGRYKE